MKYIILICLLCICYSANAEELYGGVTENYKNSEEYLRKRWTEMLGFDLFWGYFWVKETRNDIAKETIKYLGIKKWEWDLNLEIKKDSFKIEVSREF